MIKECAEPFNGPLGLLVANSLFVQTHQLPQNCLSCLSNGAHLRSIQQRKLKQRKNAPCQPKTLASNFAETMSGHPR